MTRIRLISWGICAALLVLLGRLFYMQVVQGEEYRRRAFDRIQYEKVLNPKRGQMLDRHGRTLVSNKLTYDILAIPAQLEPGVLERLAGLLELPLEEVQAQHAEVLNEAQRWIDADLQRRFGRASERRRKRARRSLTRYFNKRAYLLIEDVREMDRLMEVYIHQRRYAGLLVRSRPGRVYPHGDMASHVIGYTGRIRAEEFSRLRSVGYDANDRLGRTGLEKQFEKALRGKRGVRVTGRPLGRGKPKLLFQELPVNGADLRTTIDMRLQRVAEKALEERIAELTREFQAAGRTPPPGGAVVLMAVKTGEVLALATTPRYDPGRFGKQFRKLVADPRHPLVDRATGGRRVPPPGSVFKILSGIAGLAEQKISAGSSFNCRGYMHQPGRFRCWNTRGHGPVDLTDAIAQSCNVYFYHVGERLGGDALAAWGEAFGFGRKTGVGLPGEKAGVMPSPGWKFGRLGRPWFKADSRFTAIGQGMLETTPLQVARFMAAVATRGKLPKARIVAGAPEVRRIEVDGWIWNAVHRGMIQVVAGRRGTASRYGLEQFNLAAKTGTAEVGRNQETHAWIAGFAPHDAPEVAIAVLVENSGHGGEVTGPIAHKVLSAYFDRR